MGPNNIIYLIHTGTEMWAQREVTEGKDRQKAVERITENLRCLSPPVRGSFLWQARKYFSNLSPCWHQCVTDTNMPALLNPPLSSTFTTLLLSLNALGVMELIESGESGRGRKRSGRSIRPRSFGDAPGSGKSATLCLLIFVWRARFPGSTEVKHTVWHWPLTSD